MWYSKDFYERGSDFQEIFIHGELGCVFSGTTITLKVGGFPGESPIKMKLGEEKLWEVKDLHL